MQICYIKPIKVNKEINFISNREKQLLIKSYIITVACLNCMNKLQAKQLNETKLKQMEITVNSTGDTIVRIMQLAIYWITMFFAIFDIIKTCKKQDIAGVVTIVLKYASMMLAGYSMPIIWDFIKDMFVEV